MTSAFTQCISFHEIIFCDDSSLRNFDGFQTLSTFSRPGDSFASLTGQRAALGNWRDVLVTDELRQGSIARRRR
jgi:hypothetical protein